MKFPSYTKEREKRKLEGCNSFKENLVKGLEVMKFMKPKCITAQLGSSFGSNSTIIVLGCKQ